MEIVAYSGGKDSTAMALRLEEVAPNPNRMFLYTPTGDELPPMFEHINNMKNIIGKHRFFEPPNLSLTALIQEQNCIPNYRMRFCTRILKIEPCIEILSRFVNPILFVGLRADEELRKGLYDERVKTVYPLRDWGWNKQDVFDYLKHRNINIPERTDCALCYYQRLIDWYRLWNKYLARYEIGERLEEKTGFTFRSPSKDNHPTSLKELRIVFESGWIPGYRKVAAESRGGCRICSL